MIHTCTINGSKEYLQDTTKDIIKWIKQVGEVCIYYAIAYLRHTSSIYTYLCIIYHLTLYTYNFKNVINY